jgi:hypothetical protein
MYLDLRLRGGVASADVSSSCVSAGNGDSVVVFAAEGMMRARKAQVSCAFFVAGSVTKANGNGTCGQKFVSTSGRVVIEPAAWAHVANAKSMNSMTTIVPGTQYRWKVLPLHTDSYPSVTVTAADATREVWTTLVSGIANGSHTLEIAATGANPPAISEIRIFRPPLGR